MVGRFLYRCLYNVEQLRARFLSFSSKGKRKKKKKGVFNFLFFFPAKENLKEGSLVLHIIGESCVWPSLFLRGSTILHTTCAMRDVICLTCCSFIEMNVEEEDALIHHQSVGEILFSLKERDKNKIK